MVLAALLDSHPPLRSVTYRYILHPNGVHHFVEKPRSHIDKCAGPSKAKARNGSGGRETRRKLVGGFNAGKPVSRERRMHADAWLGEKRMFFERNVERSRKRVHRRLPRG